MSVSMPNLYLVGFMGTGKTTIGRAVGQRLGMEVLDSDHEIERQQGRPVTEIFATEGEAAFRRMERAFIETGHPPSGQLVACGGGLVIPEGMLALLHERGVVICLHASIETILARTQGQRHRPLLNVEDPAVRVRALYAAREPIYRKAGSMILTDARPLTDIVGHVIRTYRRDAADWLRRREAGPGAGRGA
jgi:shikimate kinase